MTRTWRAVASVGILLAGAALTFGGLSDAAQARQSSHQSKKDFGPLSVYKNTRFGYSLTYPSDVFNPEPESDNGDGRKFYSADHAAKVAVFGAYNTEKFTMEKYRDTLLKQFAGYEKVTYSPRGKTWFVLSGFHDGAVYYQKVMFSCGSDVINVLAINWPEASRERYDPIIELLEKNFHTGSGVEAECQR
jgi:hypothetical protein